MNNKCYIHPYQSTVSPGMKLYSESAGTRLCTFMYMYLNITHAKDVRIQREYDVDYNRTVILFKKKGYYLTSH